MTDQQNYVAIAQTDVDNFKPLGEGDDDIPKGELAWVTTLKLTELLDRLISERPDFASAAMRNMVLSAVEKADDNEPVKIAPRLVLRLLESGSAGNLLHRIATDRSGVVIQTIRALRRHLLAVECEAVNTGLVQAPGAVEPAEQPTETGSEPPPEASEVSEDQPEAQAAERPPEPPEPAIPPVEPPVPGDYVSVNRSEQALADINASWIKDHGVVLYAEDHDELLARVEPLHPIQGAAEQEAWYVPKAYLARESLPAPAITESTYKELAQAERAMYVYSTKRHDRGEPVVKLRQAVVHEGGGTRDARKFPWSWAYVWGAKVTRPDGKQYTPFVLDRRLYGDRGWPDKYRTKVTKEAMMDHRQYHPAMIALYRFDEAQDLYVMRDEHVETWGLGS